VTEGNPEQITVTDKRRIDPETGEVRHVPPGGTPGGTERAGSTADPMDKISDKVAELTEDLQRVQADFTNYRKRALRDQQAAADRAKAGVVSQLLGVLDDLERARKHGDLDSGPLKSVADKLMSALTGFGLTAFAAEGEDFDPVLHEAVQHEGDGGEGSKPVIGTVMRHGYKLGEHVLRHALVGVVDTVQGETANPAEEADTVDTVVEADEAEPAEPVVETDETDPSDNTDGAVEQDTESESSEA
jgi:molecular chaperone GrpE